MSPISIKHVEFFSDLTVASWEVSSCGVVHLSWSYKQGVNFTVAQTDKFLCFAPGCVCLPICGERLSHEGKQTDRARPVDRRNRPGGGGPLHGRSGGEAEEEGRGRYRCEPRDKRESFRNRIMASCLSAPQIVCQVTAALNRDVFI